MSKNGLQLASDLKYYLDYSRWIDDENRTETWEDSVNRVMSMHKTKYAKFLSNPRFVELFEKAEGAYKDKLVLGSQRALQFGGDPIMKHNARLYNCTATYVDRVRSFQEIMYLLLCGCFHPDTEIMTNSGVKKICEITLDDKILTYFEDTNTYEYVNPIAIHINETEDMEKFEFEMEDGSKFKCTYNHEILTDNGWVRACDLKEGDNIINFFK
jgi:hypothetical protein